MSLMPIDDDLTSRTKNIITDPHFMKYVCVHIASGGSIIDLCETWRVRYGEIMHHINTSVERVRQLDEARHSRVEWIEQKIILELTRMMSVDIREAYDDDGNLKPVKEWSHELASIVAGIETKEEYETIDGKKEAVGVVHKLKLRSKEKAIELMGKKLGLFTDIKITANVTLEDLLDSVKPRPVTGVDPKNIALSARKDIIDITKKENDE